MRSRLCLGWALAAMLAVSAAPPSAGQGPLLVPEGEVLADVAMWLASAIASYPVGKVLDKVVDTVTGRDKERELQAVEARLQTQLRQGAAGRKQIEAELGVARSELRVLRELMNGVPSAQQLARDRKEVQGDLATIRKTLAEHEKRLAEHDRLLTEQGAAIEQQGRRIDDLERAAGSMDRRAPEPRPDPQSPPGPGTPSLPPGPAGPRPSYPSSSPGGISLRIKVGGPSNFIRLLEATRPIATGTFQVPAGGMRVLFYVPSGTRAVVELFASGTLISLPARLAWQVRIVSHGWKYRTLVY